MEETRTLFDDFTNWQVAIFYIVAAGCMGVFAFGCVRLVLRYTKNRADGKESHKLHFGRALKAVMTHSGISRRAGLVGIMHAAVFYGFLVLFLGTSILTIEEHVAKPLGLSFWHGGFYRAYSLFLDVFGAFLIIGLTYFIVRRMSKPFRLDYSRADKSNHSSGWAKFERGDTSFLWSLMFIGASGFLLEALRISVTLPPFEVWSPVGYGLGYAIATLKIPEPTVDSVRILIWWLHGAVALGWIASVPFTKAVHIMTGPPSIALRDENVSRVLDITPETGYAELKDFSLTHALNLDACTKCGRCHEACPAQLGGAPLSPRDLILDLRLAQAQGTEGMLLPEVLSPDAVWSCTQCNACVEVCPVGVEHVPIINHLRRAEVERGKIESTLQSTFEDIFETGNSFGKSRRQRARWVRELDEKLPDARKTPVKILWFVGDYASMDARNKQNTLALAQLLKAADVDAGILYEAEKTAGNDVRRAGEEGLFQSLAEDNISLIEQCSFERILTSDPHSFNTLKNEYPTLGASWSGDDVVHHTVFLLELIAQQRLEIAHPLNRRVTYHDPCTLGRYNGIFDQPRELLRTIGLELVEMPRNRDNSLCCGAGGGRIWMTDTAAPGSLRPSDDRIHEALGLGDIQNFVVACPKDAVMYEEAVNATGNADRLKVKEISELVLEATGV